VRAAAQANASRDITFAALTDGALGLREGAFEVVIIENLAAVGDIAGVLKSVQRALAPSGAALIACPNPEATLRLVGKHDPSAVALDYYSLYDAVAAQFRVVRMVGQTPFVAYAMVDFAPDRDLEPTIDTGFVPGGTEEPEWFVAFASHTKTALESFMVVELAFKDVWKTLATEAEPKRQGAPERPHRLQARALPRTSPDLALETERQAFDAERQTFETERQTFDAKRLTFEAERQAFETERQALERDLQKRDAWIAELEKRAGAADSRADATQASLDELVEKSALEREEASRRIEALRKDKAELESALAAADRDQREERAAAQVELA
jgi:hypothetical protein